ncbi:GFA family protein [Pelagibius marinus]|uniref:GFA family protein n=1 Tax=Pelagibius marinus TaxID=2762760 RepID=UPI001872AE8A|nr:GFA family protein [Pelagibius marinus]
MNTRTASCACGQLRIVCEGDPELVALCHCLDCQRRTGSAFGLSAFFKREAARPEGSEKTTRRLGDSGRGLTFHFCPDCGGTVYWEPELRPDWFAVAVGTFGDPTFPKPEKAVFEQRAHPWAKISF